MRSDALAPFLGIPFVPQTMSIDFDGAEVLKNDTGQAIGIDNVWSIMYWTLRANAIGIQYLFEIDRGGSADHIEGLAQQALGGRGDFTWVDDSNSPAGVARWNNFYSVGTWINTLITWDGTELRVWKNGIQLGLPDSGDSTPVPPPVMSDGNADRMMVVGGRNTGTDNHEGFMSQLAVWRVRVDAAAMFFQSIPSSINLNANSGAYQFKDDLAHWYRPGHRASPDIGRDYAEAGFTPTIDIEVNAVGITDADRVANVP